MSLIDWLKLAAFVGGMAAVVYYGAKSDQDV